MPVVIEAPSADARYIGGERLNIAAGGKRFRCDFIEPGFVNYSDTPGLGMELLRKNAIDRALASAMGMPLIIRHVPTNSNVPVDRICGVVDLAGYDERTNWFWCEGSVDSDAAKDLIKQGWKTSVGFRVNETKPGGVDHNISYTQELTGITFHHLALVDNPRYEGANIRLNALGQKEKSTAMFKWIKNVLRPKEGGGNETVTEEGQLPADASIEIDGQQVRLNDLKDAHLKAEKAKADAAAAQLAGDTEIEVTPGNRVKVSVLAQTYRDNAKADAAKLKADEDRKKAEKAEAARLEEERKNEGKQSFRVLQDANKRPAAPAFVPSTNRANTLEDRMKLGEERYGGPIPVPGKN